MIQSSSVTYLSTGLVYKHKDTNKTCSLSKYIKIWFIIVNLFIFSLFIATTLTLALSLSPLIIFVLDINFYMLFIHTLFTMKITMFWRSQSLAVSSLNMSMITCTITWNTLITRSTKNIYRTLSFHITLRAQKRLFVAKNRKLRQMRSK